MGFGRREFAFRTHCHAYNPNRSPKTCRRLPSRKSRERCPKGRLGQGQQSVGCQYTTTRRSIRRADLRPDGTRSADWSLRTRQRQPVPEVKRGGAWRAGRAKEQVADGQHCTSPSAPAASAARDQPLLRPSSRPIWQLRWPPCRPRRCRRRPPWRPLWLLAASTPAATPPRRSVRASRPPRPPADRYVTHTHLIPSPSHIRRVRFGRGAQGPAATAAERPMSPQFC